MDTNELDPIIQTLRDKESTIIEQISELQDALDTRKASHEQIKAALAALEPKSKKSKRSRKPSPKPSASKTDVESALMEAKEANPGLTSEQLRIDAEKRLVNKGFSRSGMALRFKQVLEHSLGTKGPIH